MPTWVVPLESNPDVLNKFIYKLGVSKKWNIVDIFGLEAEMLEFVAQPVKALILLFPIFDSDQSNRSKENTEVPADPHPELFYMKQMIRNACGSIALVHSILNCDIDLDETGVLAKYHKEARNLTPEERGRMLEENQEFIKIHQEVAQEGQTEAPNAKDKTYHHFIAFVQKNGELWELDGSKDSPVNHGSSSAETFLQDAAKVCKSFMSRDPDEVHFNILALTATQD
ncbi:Ubiquitin carboxyl-terminal hydrolase [Sergentomyia squamirostris]